jgi:hypothetical protein
MTAGDFNNLPLISRSVKRGSWYEIALTNYCSTNACGNQYTAPAMTSFHHHAVGQESNQQNTELCTSEKKPRCVFHSIAWLGTNK